MATSSVELAGILIPYDTAIFSGILNNTPSITRRTAIGAKVGIVFYKSTGPEPREGNDIPSFVQREVNGEIESKNAIGLTNTGKEYAVKKLGDISPLPNAVKLAVSFFGGNPKGFAEVGAAFAPKKGPKVCDFLEANISCSHSELGCYGDSIELTAKVVKECKRVIGVPLIVKYKPLSKDLEGVTHAAIDEGADIIAGPNTFGPFEDDILTAGMGSRSGPMIREGSQKTLEIVKRVIDEYTERKIGLIGGGGVCSIDDYLNVKKVADVVAFGTVLTGMCTNRIVRYFDAIRYDILNGTDTASRLVINRNLMKYNKVNIEKIEKHTEDLRTFHINQKIKAEPGQWVFIYNGVNERPISVADHDRFAIRKIEGGKWSGKMFELEEDTPLWIRGPYPVFETYSEDELKRVKLPIKENSCLVVAGTGAAGLLLTAKKMYENGQSPKIFLGAKEAAEVLFEQDFRRYGELEISTDKGDAWYKGTVVDLLEENIKRIKNDNIYICGPPKMTRATLKLLKEHQKLDDTIVIREDLQKCGVGICGSCSDEKGYRSCVDGNWGVGTEIYNSNYGIMKRDKTFRWVLV
jgi:NAD(P)H-flavin reductase/dihydroorotate dehydrogenase